jgi:hypothetical protein
MKKLLLSLLCVGFSASEVQAVPLQDLIGEDAEFFLTVRSFSETRKQWATHPIVALFEDEDLVAFFQPLVDEAAQGEAVNGGAARPSGFSEVLEEEFGLSFDDLFELFPGQASLAFYNISELMLKQAERPEVILMAEFSGDEARLDELMQIQFKRNAEAQQAINPAMEHEMVEEQFMGVTLHFDEAFDGENAYVEDGYALVDGIFILATPESRLREAVETIKEGASAPISESDVYLRSREDAGRGDVGFYLNLVELMPPLNDALMEQSMVGGLAMFGVTAKSLESALSLESLQALYFDLDLIDEGLLSHGGLIYREKRGFLSLLSYTQGELPEARYVPEGVLSSSISLFDFGAMLANLEAVLTLASPTLPPLIDMQMQIMQTNTGIDLRASILENLGGQMVSLSMLDQADRTSEVAPQPQQLFVIDVKDAQALSQAIETFKGLAPEAKAFIEEQEYEGQTIYTIKGPSDPNLPDATGLDFSYVITRSSLIVNMGRVGLLHEVLSRMGQGGAGFWQNPQTEQLFEKIARPHSVGRSFVDAEQMIEPFFQSLLQAGAISGLSHRMRAEQIPSDLDAPYRLISEFNEEPDGLFGRTLIIKSEVSE